jgi:DNA topoisomerase-2
MSKDKEKKSKSKSKSKKKSKTKSSKSKSKSKKASKSKSKSKSKSSKKEEGAKSSGGSKTDDRADKYQRKNQLEHVLLRPDTYIGSIERTTKKMMVCDPDPENDEKDMFVEREVSYTEGALKCVDEIFVNLADAKIKYDDLIAKGKKYVPVTKVHIKVNPETGEISAKNNGSGIPVILENDDDGELEKAGERLYIPGTIFGVFRTGDSYENKEVAHVGGKNGFGAKLTNAFSKKFKLVTVDEKTKRKFSQTWKNNMSKVGTPKIEEGVTKVPWTEVSFILDFERLNMPNGIDADFMGLVKKRAYDIAAYMGKSVAVSFNGTRIQVPDFAKYIDMFVGGNSREVKREYLVLENSLPNDYQWEFGVAPSPEQEFKHSTFVNGIDTYKGGTHLDYVTNELLGALRDRLAAVTKQPVEYKHIRPFLWIFLNTQIPNPTFSSQTKEEMTSARGKCQFVIKNKFKDDQGLIDRIIKKLDLKDRVAKLASYKASVSTNKELKKSDGRMVTNLTGIPKLDDANNAGKKNRKRPVTLILTEGDSAKRLAIAGLTVINNDDFGVFPLRGKALNAFGASDEQIANNAEIINIKKIIGLQSGSTYEGTKNLRYDRVMIMTDQDLDGSHIKGLILALFRTLWPSLYEMPGFLCSFITPIVKATKNGKKGQVISFKTEQDYKKWEASQKIQSDGTEKKLAGWTIKYYKGLGTSTTAEAKEYFKELDENTKEFVWTPESNECIDLAFNKKRADDRKEWLRNYERDDYLDFNKSEFTHEEFFNKDFKHFSMGDNLRSLPGIDG